MTISFEDMVQRMSRVISGMSGEDLADLYNREFGDGMRYDPQTEAFLQNQEEDHADPVK